MTCHCILTPTKLVSKTGRRMKDGTCSSWLHTKWHVSNEESADEIERIANQVLSPRYGDKSMELRSKGS